MPEAQDRTEAGSRAGAPAEVFDGSPRGRIMAAMAEVIDHGGYAEATVDRVLEQANVSWGEFSKLFGDLDSCFLATFDAGADCAARAAAAAARAAVEGETASAGDDRAAAVLEAGLLAVLEGAAARPGLARLCFVEVVAAGPAAMGHRDRAIQRFVDGLRQAISDAGVQAPPALVAEMVVGGIHEVVQHKVRAGETATLPALTLELTCLWTKTLQSR